MKIEAMLDTDWPAVARIYEEGLITRMATFETAVPTWARWHNGHHTHSRLVIREGEQVLGWAALSPVSSRQVYAGVAEVSIYLASTVRGRGLGKQLLSALISSAEAHGIWTLQASIFPENEASVSLHQKCGFRIVGRRERIAQLDGQWRDTVLLERRSTVVGA